jgi:hypothetical protein
VATAHTIEPTDRLSLHLIGLARPPTYYGDVAASSKARTAPAFIVPMAAQPVEKLSVRGTCNCRVIVREERLPIRVRLPGFIGAAPRHAAHAAVAQATRYYSKRSGRKAQHKSHTREISTPEAAVINGLDSVSSDGRPLKAAL